MEHNFEVSYTQQSDYLLPDLRLSEKANAVGCENV